MTSDRAVARAADVGPGRCPRPGGISGSMKCGAALGLALGVLVAGAGGVGAEISVPSALELELQDVILEPDAERARFRFIAPALAGEGAPGYDDVLDDFAYLCAVYALPALEANGWRATEIVISLADRAVVFGQANPEAVQYFEAFRIENDSCFWEGF